MRTRFRFDWALILAVAMTCSCGWAWGATYNFYFNNTEQGANSTATPNLIIKDDDGKPVVAPGPSPTPVTETERLPAVSPDSGSLEPAAPVSEYRAERGFRLFSDDVRGRLRMIVAGTYERTHQRWEVSKDPFTADPWSSKPFWEQKETKTGGHAGPGMSVSGSYFFHPNLGATITLGSLSGFEFEGVPFGFKEHVIEPAVLLGWMGPLRNDSRGDAGAFFSGVRLSLNIASTAALHVSARKSLASSENEFDFSQVEGGLSFYF